MSTKKSDKNLNCKGFFLLVPTVCNVCCNSYTGLRGCVYAFPDKRDLCASHALYWCTGFRLLLSDSTVRPVSRMSSWRWLGASLMGYHTDGSVRQRQHNKTKQNKTKENKICTDLANHSESTKVITSTSTVTYNWAWIFFFLYLYFLSPITATKIPKSICQFYAHDCDSPLTLCKHFIFPHDLNCISNSAIMSMIYFPLRVSLRISRPFWEDKGGSLQLVQAYGKMDLSESQTCHD